MTQRTYQTTLLIRGDSRNAVRSMSLTRDELEKLTGAQGKSATGTQRMGQAFLRANANVGRLTRGLQGFGGLLGAIGITAFAQKTIRSADSLANMRGQLKLVTDSQEELNAVYSRALSISNATGQATESTISLYARLARSTEELNLTQDDLFRITNAVNQSFVVSGASTQEANSAVLQLSQGLAAGALRGEELNSVMENSPRLARALADGLGVSIGELRALGSEGELTAERVTTALLASADGIAGEFAEMPMTIGRSMQALANSVNDALGDVDTGPLQESVASAQALIADPGFRSSIQSLAAGLLDLSGWFAKTLTAGQRFSKWLGEELAARLGEIADDDIPRLEAEVARLEKKLNTGLGTWGRTADRVAELTEKLDQARLRLADARRAQEDFTRSQRLAAEASEQAAAEAEALAAAERQAAEEVAQLAAEAEESARQIAVFDSVMQDLGITSVFAAESASESWAAFAQSPWFRDIVDGSSEASQATANLGEVSEAAATALQDLGDRADPVAAAIERGAERMDDAFARFFTDMLRDGKLSFDGLKDLALNTLGEVIYAFARNKVLLNVGAAGGFGAAASNAAAGVGSTLSSGFSGIAGAVANGFTGLGAGAYNLLADGAYAVGLDTLGLNARASAGLGAGGMALNAGAGIAGGILGNAVFGETSGIGSTILGFAGSAFGPIGAAIGSFVGSGVEKVITDLFGDSKPDFASAYQTLDFDRGGAIDRGLFGTGDREAVAGGLDSLSQVLSAFGQAVGAQGLLRVGVNNRDGLFVADQQFSGSDTEAFLDAAFDQILRQTNLPQSLKDLISAFDGTTEEVVSFASSVVSLSDAIKRNPVDEAVKAFEELNNGQQTATAQYFRQAESLQALIDNYDGSAQSAQNLSLALNANQQAAYQLTMMILDASSQMNVLTANSAKYIRQSVLNEEELREARESEAQDIFDSLSTLVDPQEIRSALADYERLNTQIFQSLDNANAETAETFASRIEAANAIGQAQLEQARQSIREEAESFNFQISQLLQDGVQRLNDAAVQFNTSTQQFGAYVQVLTSQGIQVTVPAGGETVL